MKGYVAICQHFHQPHFQLYQIRESVYKLSYLSWIELLEKLSSVRGFYMNMHFSGPFLYWLKDQKNDYLIRLKKIIETGTIGIVGGFSDESFVQLSTRTDDVLFQIKEYEKLTNELFGVQASEWQGFHIPERECGELLIKNTTNAISMVCASPIYYLDAETFYPAHYAESGGIADYCNRLFGFKDPVSKTTFSHYPKSLLHFAFRDMIAGKEFVTLPIHCEERYWFLKNDMSSGIQPAEYLKMLKQSIDKAQTQANAIGKETVPVIVIFEDAEKFGAWSGNPSRDYLWLKDLIELICNDDELSLIGLKDYCDAQGCLDTYPIRSSHSYIEFENWTAKRGVRGIAYGDEKIRKMVTMLHHLEDSIESYERKVLKKYTNISNERFITALMDAPDRYIFISEVLSDNAESFVSKEYLLLQRIRNLLYQEDSKWAIRHPNYGSAPYLDNMGICFLEIAEKILFQLNNYLGVELSIPSVTFVDWMENFDKRLLVHSENQTVSIALEGASVDYHVAQKYNDVNTLLSKVFPDITNIKSYPSIYRYVTPVVFTETDSKLCHEFNKQGARIEKCRRSFAIGLSYWNGTDFEQIADYRDLKFLLKEHNETVDGIKMVFQTTTCIKKKELNCIVKLTRIVLIKNNGISVETTIETDNTNALDLYLSIEVVTSLTASDEVNFCPSEGLTILEGAEPCNFVIVGIDGCKKNVDYRSNGTIVFSYSIRTGENEMFDNSIKNSFSSNSKISHILIAPTVINYYENYVGKEQSRLGYSSSGVMITPYTRLINGKASLLINQNLLWDTRKTFDGMYISLV